MKYKHRSVQSNMKLQQALKDQLLLNFIFPLIQFDSLMLFSAELPIGYNYISIPNCLRRTQQGYTETHLLPSHCVSQSHHYILVCCVLKRVVKHTITNFHNSLALLLCHSIAMVKYHSTQLSFLSPHKDHKRNVIEMQRFVHYTFKIFKVK